MEDIKKFLWVAGICVVFVVAGLLVWYVVFNPWVLAVVGVLAALVVAALLWLSVLWLQEKTAALVARREQHKLALEISRDELEERRWRRDLEASRVYQVSQVAQSRVQEEVPLMIEQAHSYRTGLELFQSGKVPGRDIMIGYDMATGNELWLPWKVLKGILILGISEGGKSSTGAWLLAQHVAQGGKFMLVDQHAAVDDSMWSRVRALRSAMIGEVANTTDKAVKTAKKAYDVMRGRYEGDPDRTPFLLVVDEFTSLMSEGAEVSKEVANVIRSLNAEGRKVNCYVLAIGQATNADSAGGTSVRDIFPTRIMHRMKTKQAQNLGQDKQEKAIIKGLGKGEVFVETDVHVESIAVKVPYAGEDVIALIGGQLRHASEPLQGHFREVSEGRKSSVLQLPETTVKNHVKSVVGPSEKVLPEKAERVLKMVQDGMGKVKVVETVWTCKAGSSKAYKQAVLEFDQIMESLVTLGYVG